MPYVMIPVPEEHVEEVMQFTLRAITQAAIQPWDEESITEIYDDVDESTRSLLAFVARAASEGEELAADAAARSIELTVREAVGIVNELNTRTREAERPSLIIVRNLTERLPNGRTADKKVLQMSLEIADLVRAAELAEVSGAQNPGTRDPE